MKDDTNKQHKREGPQSNKIDVSFEKAVDILLSTPPKKPTRKKRPNK